MKIFNNIENKEMNKELDRVFWRSFQMEFAWNYERQMNLGYVYAMIPVLKKIYANDKEGLKKALKRHLEFFNMTPHIVTLMLGISSAMEKENSESENFDENSINNIKTALMGPLSGIGDSFFWGTLRLLATGIGTALSLQGNILGPILFLLIFNIPHIFIRYIFTKLGYKLGIEFLNKLEWTDYKDFLKGKIDIEKNPSAFANRVRYVGYVLQDTLMSEGDLIEQLEEIMAINKKNPKVPINLCDRWLERLKSGVKVKEL